MTKKKKTSAFVERVLKLVESDAQLARHMPNADLWEGLKDTSLPLADRIDNLLSGYGDRPALGERAYRLENKKDNGELTRVYDNAFDAISYSDLRDRIRSVAAAWTTQDKFRVNSDDLVCMMGFAGIDYAALDIACIYVQAVSVPIQANYGFEVLKGMLEKVEPTVLATTASDLDMAVRLATVVPSLRSLIVFDYDDQDSRNQKDWNAAKEKLENNGKQIATISMNDLVALGDEKKWKMLPPHNDGTERLTSIVHSSGSTGTPKGAMLPERAVAKAWHGILPRTPMIGICLAPLNHLVGRLSVQSTLGIGGYVNFTLAEDMSTLIEDIRITRPIIIGFIPRILDMIYQDYLNQVSRKVNTSGISEEQARDAVMSDFRGSYLGDRLISGTVGSAPTTKEMREFMMTCFGIQMADGYGNTESGTGSVTVNNRIIRHSVTDYKLRDVPELGYLTTDKPYPRGELCIKTHTQILGYYKNPEATAKLIDEDGYYSTGDIVVEKEPDHVEIIDRVNDVLKLSQGEYVAVGRLGTIFETESDLIEQIYIYGNSLRSYLVAVVVPNKEALASILGKAPSPLAEQSLIRENFQTVGRAANLKSFEIPRDFILESELFSTENGLLTSVLKKKRPALRAKYGEQLEAIYEASEKLKSDQLKRLKNTDSKLTTEEKLRALLASNLGLEEDEIYNAKSYKDHGGDSLGSVAFSLAIEDIFGLEIPSNDILSPAGNIEKWAKLISSGPDGRLATFEDVHGRLKDEVFANDLQLRSFLPQDVLNAARGLPAIGPKARKTVFLTGANGFLGRFICLEWLKKISENGGKLICLIRAKNDAAAKKRLADTFAAAGQGMLSSYNDLQDHIEVVAGDFGQPLLGLSPEKFETLAKDVDVVSHVGALVNHVMDYQSLFAPNVAGVAEIIRFALTSKKKSIDFVSTVAVTPHLQLSTGGTESAELAEKAKLNDRYANGYGASKWAGEVLLKDAEQCFGLPVCIFRGDMMLAHREMQGQINIEDLFTRMLYSIIKTGLAPKSFHDLNPNGTRALVPYAGVPVNVVAASVVGGGEFFTDASTVFCIDNAYTDLKNSMDAFVDWIIDAGYTIQRLDAHEDWFSRFKRRMTAMPEREKKRSALAVLKAYEVPHSFIPFRAESTNFQSLVGKLGIEPAEMQLDADFIYKCLKDMAFHGLIDEPKKKPKSKSRQKPKTKTTPAYGVTSKASHVQRMDIERRLPGAKDVAIDIEYCGVCHSDIHFAHNDWGITQYPLVPGHEIIGRVTAIGKEVSEITVGERVAVGCMVDSCGSCGSCDDGLEQYCDSGLVLTYNSYDHRHENVVTYGGYSDNIVVKESFVIPVPENLDPAGAAPLLCAGITTWSPLREWDIKPGMRVGIIGLGGLGHMGVKFSAALGAHTVLISRSADKAKNAKRLGADEILVSKDLSAMRDAKGSFDFILDTVPVHHDIDDYLRLLKRDGTLCLVGALEPLDFHSGRVAGRRKRITGSSIGSIAETREMLAFCGKRNITADIELIKPADINAAWERVEKSDVKYRFVIDMKG